ncbi:MAG: beta-lactamase [Acidimicrobiaceae bacterium]|nr:beta-lactamase [Acidimicrobiaceae bacterium]
MRRPTALDELGGAVSAAAATPDGLEVRQLLAGRDFARHDRAAAQMANYVYAVLAPSERVALLVDPAWAPGELVDLLAGDGYALEGVVLTHYHADHAGGRLGGPSGLLLAGVAELLEVAEVPVHVQNPEIAWLERTTGLPSSAFVVHSSGDRVGLGQGSVTLLHTPGHTRGSQCVLVDESLLTGDTLFLEGCGRTDLPGGDPRALQESLSQRLAALADSTEVLPGHAYAREPSASLGWVRRTNAVLAPLSEQEWLARFS